MRKTKFIIAAIMASFISLNAQASAEYPSAEPDVDIRLDIGTIS